MNRHSRSAPGRGSSSVFLPWVVQKSMKNQSSRSKEGICLI